MASLSAFSESLISVSGQPQVLASPDPNRWTLIPILSFIFVQSIRAQRTPSEPTKAESVVTNSLAEPPIQRADEQAISFAMAMMRLSDRAAKIKSASSFVPDTVPPGESMSRTIDVIDGF